MNNNMERFAPVLATLLAVSGFSAEAEAKKPKKKSADVRGRTDRSGSRFGGTVYYPDARGRTDRSGSGFGGGVEVHLDEGMVLLGKCEETRRKIVSASFQAVANIETSSCKYRGEERSDACSGPSYRAEGKEVLACKKQGALGIAGMDEFTGCVVSARVNANKRGLAREDALRREREALLGGGGSTSESFRAKGEEKKKGSWMDQAKACAESLDEEGKELEELQKMRDAVRGAVEQKIAQEEADKKAAVEAQKASEKAEAQKVREVLKKYGGEESKVPVLPKKGKKAVRH